MLRYLVYQQH